MVLLMGTIGYMMIEGYSAMDALYMTVITISTVGYQELKPLSHNGRVFTIFLILANIGIFTYFLSQLSSYFLDGEFQRTYKLFKMKNSISELKGHTIICGFGRNGREAAKLFHLRGEDYVVIETVPYTHEGDNLNVKFYIQDNATRDEVLMEAGILNASALISTLPDDADSLFVVLTARELNKSLKIVSRASHDSSVKKLKTAGANNVIMPDKIGGAHMASLVLSPDIKEFVDLMSTHNSEHFSIHEMEVNRTVSLDELDSWHKTGATVLGIKTSHADFSLNPAPNTVLRPGNHLIVMGNSQQLSALKTRLTE